MSDGKPGRPRRTGTIIKIRVSDHVLNVYLPRLLQRYPTLDRAAVGGIALEAAAKVNLLVTESE